MRSRRAALLVAAAAASDLVATAVASMDACIASGAGDWVASSLEPVKLSPTFLKNWQQSVFFWGQCEEAPRALRWEPRGEGCDGLAATARSPTLAQDFCDAFSGASVLLVGDSVQGELFSTLAALLGADRGVQDEAAARRRCLPGSRLMAHHAHEVRVETLACDGRLGIEFIRNEFLLWAGARDTLDAAAIRRQDNKYLCDWADDASGADLLVLSRGLHEAPDAAFAEQLAATLDGLSAARGAPNAPWLVYRGSHAVVPNCHAYADPSPESLADRIVATPGEPHSAAWANISHQNRIAKDIADARGVTYMDVFAQTARRPGARPDWHAGECMHYCVPGPIDDWARLLLAYWLEKRRSR